MAKLSRAELLEIARKKAEEKREEAERRECLPHLYANFYEWQEQFIYSQNRMNLLNAANQIGKMQTLHTVIPTPNGFKTMGDLSIGDYVFGRDGIPARIVDIPYEGVRPIYKFTFDDGSTVESGKEHLWICKTSKQRFRKTYTSGDKTWENPEYDKWVTLSTEDIIKAGKYSPEAKSNYTKVSIPVCDPVQYPEINYDVDPYVLGLLLGDGSLANSISFSSGDLELCEKLPEFNYKCEEGKYSGYLSNMTNKIRDLGLFGTRSHTKFIPDKYLLGSADQRLDLLRGLMDTDGSIYGRNTLEYCTVSPDLRDGFVELINSLGGMVNRISEKNPFYYDKNGDKVFCKKAYSICFKIQVNPFNLKRKAVKWRKNIKYRHERLIEKIEYVGDHLGRCITVDNKDHSYLTGKEYVVTHNSVSLIVRCIKHATEPETWKDLWPDIIAEGKKPTTFWYFHTDHKTLYSEFHEKWVKEWLPRGKYKTEGRYRWEHIERNREMYCLKFPETGTTIYFKTYEMNPKNTQAATVYEVFCFTEGHKVLTKRGNIPVEDVRIGDYVFTREGEYREVKNTLSRKKHVITREFSNGKTITGTPDHRFMTKNRGYVQFSELTESDEILTIGDLKWKKRLLDMMELPFIGILIRKTAEDTTLGACIFRKLGVLAKRYTSIFGKNLTIKNSLKGILYTIKMKIQQIMKSRIYNYLQKLSIMPYIKQKCGKLLNIKDICAKNVASYLPLELLKKQPVHIVERGAATELEEEKMVYNLTVDTQHNYFLEGMSVSNCDEEMPPKFYDETKVRLLNTLGYFNSAFTATSGYDMWRRAMELQGRKDEMFPQAKKWQISLYQCTHYSNGTPTKWNDPKNIQHVIDGCSTKNEELKRVWGRFVLDEGLMVPQFNMDRHTVDKAPVPNTWSIYAGIDAGSGGNAHPPGIVFVAVNPEYTKARVIKCWRGDGQDTTNTFTFQKYQEMAKGLNVVMTVYDKQCRDLFLIASQLGVSLTPSDKRRDQGFGLLNSLFKNDMLTIEKGYEEDKLVGELMTYSHSHTKKKASTPDNLIDPLRYLCMDVPWDMDKVLKYNREVKKIDKYANITDPRERAAAKMRDGVQVDNIYDTFEKQLQDTVQEEIDNYNDMLEDFE